jgi:hypothetical protein
MGGNYTITITPDNGAQTTVHVDASGSTPRITTLAVQAQDGSGLAPGQLPAVDLELLLRAVTPTGKGREASASTVTEEAAPARRTRGARAGRGSGRRGSPTKPARGAKATFTSEKAAKATRRSAPSRRAAADSTSGGRAYRRTPDDLLETYAQAGSITAVADHYGVPRHTAQGWIGRLRRLGQLPTEG